jgi:hypothetical protein
LAAIDYDTEFVEQGPTQPIRLLSIGMVADNGDELYRVLHDSVAMAHAIAHPWLRENVVPHLPVRLPTGSDFMWRWDTRHPDYGLLRNRFDLADEVLDFVRCHGDDDSELWAWYAAYDHVALCQLWGTMADLPEAIPMYTHDLKQEADRFGNPALPPMPGAVGHRAIDDARECQYRRRWLASQSGEGLL